MTARALVGIGHHVAAAAISPRTRRGLRPPLHAGDKRYFGGADYVQGVVRILEVPSLAFVILHDADSGLVAARRWTNSAGEFRFDNIDPARKFYAVAFDPVSGEKAEVFDRI